MDSRLRRNDSCKDVLKNFQNFMLSTVEARNFLHFKTLVLPFDYAQGE
ncbi:MAG: hypothetical protein V4642_13315 [Bacteroidota bacterium]